MQLELSPDYHGPPAEPTVAVGRETLGGGRIAMQFNEGVRQNGRARLIRERDATEMAVVWVQGDPG